MTNGHLIWLVRTSMGDYSIPMLVSRFIPWLIDVSRSPISSVQRARLDARHDQVRHAILFSIIQNLKNLRVVQPGKCFG